MVAVSPRSLSADRQRSARIGRDPALRVRPAGGGQAQQAEGAGRGLARPALADDRCGLAALDGIRDALGRRHGVKPGREFGSRSQTSSNDGNRPLPPSR
jgi:hypothetical protein